MENKSGDKYYMNKYEELRFPGRRKKIQCLHRVESKPVLTAVYEGKKVLHTIYLIENQS